MNSVVVATWNGEKYVREQLASILLELSAQDEVIVCDDASSDDTINAVLGMADARVKVIPSRERLGYVRNFERGIREARGQNVFLSDQDDIWMRGKVEACLSGLERAQCVASDLIVVDANLNVLQRSYFRMRNATGFSAFQLFLKPAIVGATIACKRSFLHSLVPFPRGVPHDFWISLNASMCGALHVINQPLVLYRRHERAASLTASGRTRPMLTVATERARILLALASRARRKNH